MSIETRAEQGIWYCLMCYHARIFSDKKWNNYLEANINKPGRSLADDKPSYWAQKFAEGEARLDARFTEDKVNKLTAKWKKNLHWGGTMLLFVKEFGRPILYTMPWDELGRISKRSQGNLSSIHKFARGWALERATQPGLRSFLQGLHDAIIRNCNGRYSLQGPQPQYGRDLKTRREDLQDELNLLLDKFYAQWRPQIIAPVDVEQLWTSDERHHNNGRTILCDQENNLLGDASVTFPVKICHIYELRQKETLSEDTIETIIRLGASKTTWGYVGPTELLMSGEPERMGERYVGVLRFRKEDVLKFENIFAVSRKDAQDPNYCCAAIKIDGDRASIAVHFFQSSPADKNQMLVKFKKQLKAWLPKGFKLKLSPQTYLWEKSREECDLAVCALGISCVLNNPAYDISKLNEDSYQRLQKAFDQQLCSAIDCHEQSAMFKDSIQ